jgi:membrane protein DedA with SNARE-associated domain
MDIPALVAQYGYLAVLVGAFLEGETVLALAGLAAHQGYLDFTTVVVIAGLAGFAGDQFFFLLGRYRGAQVLARFPAAQAKAHRFDVMVSRWHAPLIVMVRFMYGFRILGPILFGMGRCRHWKFVLYNAIGAAIWAPLVAGAGWVFGRAIEAVLRDAHEYQTWLFAAILVAGLSGVLFHRIRDRWRDRTP